MMIGCWLEDYFPSHVKAEPGEEFLKVERLSSPAGFTDVSFSLRSRRSARFCGGSSAPGCSEVATALFGLDRQSTGRAVVRGQPASSSNAAHAIALGIGLVPEDRKRQGLVLSMDVLNNATLSIRPPLPRASVITRWR